MSADSASRALRALAADLAALGDDDLDAILGELDLASRERLLDLIAAFRRGDARTPTPPAPADAPVLSPWLSGRLRGEAPELTASALQALRGAAAAVGWSDRPAAPSPPPRRGVLSRLGLGR